VVGMGMERTNLVVVDGGVTRSKKAPPNGLEMATMPTCFSRSAL
jgi:hypothetical protein